MPSAPLKPCPEPRCPNLTTGGRCEQHRKALQRADTARRGTAQERGYNYRWSQVSQQHLRAFPLCGMRASDAYQDGWTGECAELGRVTKAEVTDHIRAHKGNKALFWDSRNRQSLCRSCNGKKAVMFEGAYGRPPQ